MAHSPAPWTARKRGNRCVNVVAADKRIVCSFRSDLYKFRSAREIADNARLIESGPRLLAEMREIAKQTEGFDPESKLGLIHARAIAALKANGVGR